MPDVTVVIPTRDRWRLLEQTLATVLAQRDVDLEVVVVDEASGDATPAGLAAVADPRLRVIRNERPAGVAAARNAGIEAARGAWVATVDDDDLWTPDKLAAQLAALAATGREWGYCGAVTFTEGPVLWFRMNPPDAETLASRLPWKNVVPAGASNVIMRRDRTLTLGGFDPDLQHLADWDLWLRLLAGGLPAVARMHGVAYRQHAGSMQTKPEGILDELDVIESRHRVAREGRPLDRGAVLRWIARGYLRAGARAHARRAFLDAYRQGHPRSPRYLLGAARTLVPVEPFPGTVRDRILRRHVLEWPPGMEAWLRTATAGR